jgi:5'-nucleotidase
MRILITNDDGVQAEGIQALAAYLNKQHDVFVVAPERERSATGHGITMHKPLRVTEVKMRYCEKTALAVSGTPADCVKLAVEELMEKPPDVIVSGINCGANMGTDILYSGTVSAAIEGTLNGFKSMAVSLDTENSFPDFSSAVKFSAKLIEIYFQNKMPADTLLNVNIPDVPWEEVKGVQITSLSTRKYVDSVERRQDPRGRPYFWLAGHIDDQGCQPDSDAAALKNNFISISPVHFDLTNYEIIEEISRWKINK